LATSEGQLATASLDEFDGENFVEYLGPDTEFARLLANHLEAHSLGSIPTADIPVVEGPGADQPVAIEPDELETIEDDDGMLIGLTPDDDQTDVHTASCCCGCGTIDQ
ncbi:MAG: hypothetical protein AAGE98_21995, partial [Actinomycetota bacterium]